MLIGSVAAGAVALRNGFGAVRCRPVEIHYLPYPRGSWRISQAGNAIRAV
jgi:hypothetical protein